jgi:large subunit ribosomal protein L19
VKEPVAAFTATQLAVLDPAGERRALFDKKNRQGVKVGDILRVTFKSGDPFAGVCLNIRSRGIDTAFLLRNKLTKIGCEMWIKLYSPNVEGVEIIQRTEKRKRRARLTYMRLVHATPINLFPLFHLRDSFSLLYELGNRNMIWEAWKILSGNTLGIRPF